MYLKCLKAVKRLVLYIPRKEKYVISKNTSMNQFDSEG